MADKQLRLLAKRIYDIARHEVWAGGKVVRESHLLTAGPNWPKGVETIKGWEQNLTWTLSPEVELGGIRLRVCISWNGGGVHGVRVFADDELKYPGGFYPGKNKSGILFRHKDAWSWMIARTERADGGKIGRVEARGLLLKEADERIWPTRTQQDGPDIVNCATCEEAIAEVERIAPTSLED